MTTTYYGATDENGTPIGVFRVLVDDANQTVSMERVDDQGKWVDDPSIIEELREPEVQQIDVQTANTMLAELGATTAAQTESDQEAQDAGSPLAPKRPAGADNAAG